MKGAELPDQPVAVEAISGSFMFVRRTAMEQVGKMDEGYFLHCEDLDWCRRYRDEGFQVLFVPDAVATHHQGACSAGEPVKVSMYKHRGMIRYYRKFGAGGSWNPAWLVVAALIWAHYLTRMLVVIPGSNIKSTRQATVPDIASPSHVANTQEPGDITAIVVAGGGSMLAGYLLPIMLSRGFEVAALSRSGAWHVGAGGLRWYANTDDLVQNGVFNGRKFVLVNLAPLWVLPGLIEALASHGLQRIIAFGSTSRFSKQDSADRIEQELVQTLAESERASTAAAKAAGIPLTLFRPTMIYSGGGDQNVSAIARFVRRYRIFPLLGQGRGLRQPVHAEDLAGACLNAIERPASAGKSYDLGGGEQLTYHDMVWRICKAVGRRPLLVTIPRWLFVTAVALARWLPRYRHINVAMIDRMNQDLVYDQSAAEHDLGWAPRRFLAVRGR
jgi:hypothetical protein